MAVADEGRLSIAPLKRPIVLWHGPTLPPAEALEFERRGLLIEVRDDGLENRLAQARALVVVHQSGSPDAALHVLRRWGRRALDHGLIAITLTADEPSTRAIIGGYQALPWTRHKTRARLREAAPAYEIAETIARSDPGPSANPLLIISGLTAVDIRLPATVQFLLSRAFHDCKSLVVQPLLGGRAAFVYRVHAYLDRSNVGPVPLPFFAKVAKRAAIEAELERYREYVAGFIPSHLHPRLDEHRCVDGATQSLLVGGFVESSEPLVDAVVRGMGEGPLQALCAQTLRGWHMQAFAMSPREASLATSLDLGELAFREATLTAARLLGLPDDTRGLAKRLQSLPARPHLVGPIHGDLHARNVQVRNGESMLIDFRSTRTGPIAADLASLEVSLAFDSYGDGTTQASWTAAIEALYSIANIDAPPKPLLNHTREAWLWGAVRLIRQQASFLTAKAQEYRELLAIYLLRRGCFRVESERLGDDHRRAYALVVGERLLSSLEGERK